MKENNKIEEIIENLKEYIDTNYELIRLEAVERSSILVANISSGIIVGILGFLCILFISISAGLYFSTLLGHNYLGFAIVAAFYLLLLLILLIIRKNTIEKPLQNSIIKKMLNKS